jgi:hypothetical protein
VVFLPVQLSIFGVPNLAVTRADLLTIGVVGGIYGIGGGSAPPNRLSLRGPPTALQAFVADLRACTEREQARRTSAAS